MSKDEPSEDPPEKARFLILGWTEAESFRVKEQPENKVPVPFGLEVKVRFSKSYRLQRHRRSNLRTRPRGQGNLTLENSN